MRTHLLSVGAGAICASAGLATAAFAHSTPPARIAVRAATIRSGYYADATNVTSAEMTFHLRQNGTTTTDLSLLCVPKDQRLIAGSGDAGVAVVAPKLTVHDGRLSYQGSAIVKPFSAGEKQTGTSTLKLSLRHVDGPVIHYVHEGEHFSETTAWKGTVYSPVCTKIGDHGRATLFGPVPGE